MVFGAAPGRGLDTPVPDTLEGAMAALPAVGYLFSAARLAEVVGDEKPGTTIHPSRATFRSSRTT
mgnify:CR=1 FL=1